MCRPDRQTVSRSAAALGRWRTGSSRTSQRSPASPMTTGGRRCARGRPRSWIRSPDVVPPITDRNRGAVLRFQNTKSDARHHYHHTRPFARFQPALDPFRSASSLPVAPFPSACSPVSVSVSVSVCSEESRLFHGYFRIREGHDQTRGKNSRKTDLDDSSSSEFWVWAGFLVF